jgi:hypothetical protein
MQRSGVASSTVWVLLLCLAAARAQAEERILAAAWNQVVEIDRDGRVTQVVKHPGHSGIWDAWRLPDGGIFYTDGLGMAVFDRAGSLVREHSTARSDGGAGTVRAGGAQFAVVDHGTAEIRVVTRSGAVVSRTPLPASMAGGPATPFRTIRESSRGDAFWLAHYFSNRLIEVERGSGRVLSEIDLGPHLVRSPPGAHHAFAIVQAGDGVYTTTATGLQLLRLDAPRKPAASRTAGELGLAARYLLGMQLLRNGNIMLACGDYHLKSAAAGRDVLAEVSPEGKVVWKLTRDRIVNQIEGFVDPKTGIEEMRMTSVHVYDTERIFESLEARR